MTLPTCGEDNDGQIVVHKGETLRCKRGQWIVSIQGWGLTCGGVAA
jgi:hypothetical protein